MTSSSRTQTGQAHAHVSLTRLELTVLINSLNEALEALGEDDFKIRTAMSVEDSFALSARLRRELDRLCDADGMDHP